MRIIAGTARGRTIDAPKGRDTRPTLDRVRENLFNILQRKTWDAKVLDLFAGTGALSLESLSRGAAEAVLVDCDRAAHVCQKQNVDKLGFNQQTRILLMDWKQALRQLTVAGDTFDLVFLDPPYAMRDMAEVMEALKPLLAEDAVIILEHEAQVMPSTADGYEMYDSRKYGYVGVSFFRRAEA